MPKGEKLPTRVPETGPEVISSTLYSVEHFRKLKPVDKHDSKECSKRVDMFFKYCIENDCLPTVELLCLALGRSRQTLIEWQHDEGCENGKIVERAKAGINAMLTNMALTNKVNSVYVMFSQKSNFGYVEPKEPIEIAVSKPGIAPLSVNSILEQLPDLPEPLLQTDMNEE